MFARNLHWALPLGVAGLLITTIPAYAAIADTGFEVSDNYPDPTDPNNGLGGYYDVNTLDGQGGRPFADPSEGWGLNDWAGINLGASYSFVERDGTAYQGLQHLVLHRSDQEILLRRRFVTTAIGDQMTFSFAVRMDSAQAVPGYFGGAAGIFLEYRSGADPHVGEREVHIEFNETGELVAKRGDPNGDDVTIGKWDGTGTLPSALNQWVTLRLAVSSDLEEYYVVYAGTYLGTFRFRSPLDEGEVLHQIRFNGPKGLAATDGMSIDAITIDNGITEPVTTCLSAVAPNVTRTVSTRVDQPVSQNLEYEVRNLGSGNLNYNIEELDASQTATNVPWLLLSKTNGSASSLGNDTFTATVNTTGMASGFHTAYVRVTDNCSPARQHIRRIDVTIISCTWQVDSCSQVRSYLAAYSNPGANDYRGHLDDAVFSITNTGAFGFNYTVTPEFQQPACANWLTLVNASGTLAPSAHAQVRAVIDPSALVGCPLSDSFTCRLRFTDNCSSQEITRDIRLRIPGTNDLFSFEYAGDIDPLLDDSAGDGMKFVVEEGNANGAVEAATGAANSMAFHIDDPDSIKTKYQIRYWDDIGQTYRNVPLWGEIGATVVGRVKVGSVIGSREGGLFIWEAESISASYHWGGADGVVRENHRSQQVNVPGSDDWVVVRLTVLGRTGSDYNCSRVVRLYLNENPDPIIDIVSASSQAENEHEGLGFGAGSTSGEMDIYFDWVTGTNAGAFAPGEEIDTLGFSLVPDFCPEPFADTDDDGDVDHIDFGAWQACFDGLLANDRPECRCFDRTFDGHVSQDDFAAFNDCFSGPTVLADPLCGH